jgi:diguanylate cyclase (GGDEF)-like protein
MPHESHPRPTDQDSDARQDGVPDPETQLRAALARNAELLDTVAQMQEREQRTNGVGRLRDLLHACSTQDEAYRTIAAAATTLFPGRSGFLAMLNPGERNLASVARWGERAPSVAAIAPGACRAMRSGVPHQVVHPDDAPVCRHLVGESSPGCLCVPLAEHGESLGLLCLLGSADDASRSALTRETAVAVGEVIQRAIADLRVRASLLEQASVDVLTGLHNRRYLDDSLTRELHRAVRRRSPLCVAMLDIDHFKRFNDMFGHQAGDVLLRELGRTLRDQVRKSDISCRYGGEEFVLVFPDSSLADTSRRVARVCARVRDLGVRDLGRHLGRITLSAGVAEAHSEGSTASDLLRAADEALYAAKRAGRDRIAEHDAPAGATGGVRSREGLPQPTTVGRRSGSQPFRMRRPASSRRATRRG